MNNNSLGILKQTLIIIVLTLLGSLTIIFSNLYFNTFVNGFIYDNINLLKIFIFLTVSLLTVFAIVFFRGNREITYKLFLIFCLTLSIFFIVIYILKKTEVFYNFSSIESFRAYVASFGSFASILFIIIQFLQVVILPIPAFITVGAGVLLFGPFWGGVFSSLGIISGSILAFFIGRKFGFNATKWLIGKKNLEKGLKYLKGKDKILLTFMLLFPFFPDDVLCFVAGITSISTKYFIIMIFIVRIISIFSSTYSMNNNLIPYNTWWGIISWILIFALLISISFFVMKNSEKIENYFKRKFKKKNE